MVSLNQIQEFIAHKQIAVIGASRNSKKFGFILVKELMKKGISVFPVNPSAQEILQIKCYPDIQSLPSEVKAAVFVTKPDVTEKLIPVAIEKGILQIWLQKGAENNLAIEYAQKHSANIIYKQCLLMFLKPSVWVHDVHRFFKKLSGNFPK